MRIAVLIIGLCLTALIGLQSCAVALTGNLAQRPEAAGAGSIGVLVAFMFVLGSGFALGLPRVAMVIFIIAGAFAFLAAAGSGFTDMYYWGGISLVLSAMSWFGYRELAKRRAVPATDAPRAP